MREFGCFHSIGGSILNQSISLKRSLGLWSVILFGLAYMTPMIVFGTFGTLSKISSGTTSLSYLIAACTIFLTAISYAHMSRIYPVAGSAYTYVSRSINANTGFLIGWILLLDYLFLPMVIWLIGASYLSEAFPHIPDFVWILSFIIITTLINYIGVIFATRVNLILMIVQIAVLSIFVLLAIRYVVASQGVGGIFSVEPFFKANVPFSATIAASAIAAYSFLGFDAVSTMSEEVRDAKKTMPRAILWIAFLGGFIFIATSYFVQLAHPDINFKSVDAAGFEIAQKLGSDIFVAIFLATLIVAQFTSGLAAQSSVGRLLYAMGRDGVLPKKIFSRLHPKWHTPIFNLTIVGFVGLMALVMDISTSTSFINFGAFLAFISVNISVMVLYFKKHPAIINYGPIFGLVIPALAALCDFYLFSNLDRHALLLGVIWLCIGIAYLFVLTRCFTRPAPQLHFNENEVVLEE